MGLKYLVWLSFLGLTSVFDSAQACQDISLGVLGQLLATAHPKNPHPETRHITRDIQLTRNNGATYDLEVSLAHNACTVRVTKTPHNTSPASTTVTSHELPIQISQLQESQVSNIVTLKQHPRAPITSATMAITIGNQVLLIDALTGQILQQSTLTSNISSVLLTPDLLVVGTLGKVLGFRLNTDQEGFNFKAPAIEHDILGNPHILEQNNYRDYRNRPHPVIAAATPNSIHIFALGPEGNVIPFPALSFSRYVTEILPSDHSFVVRTTNQVTSKLHLYVTAGVGSGPDPTVRQGPTRVFSKLLPPKKDYPHFLLMTYAPFPRNDRPTPPHLLAVVVTDDNYTRGFLINMAGNLILPAQIHRVLMIRRPLQTSLP